MRASLALLDIASDSVTVPLYSATYRAALGGVDFSLYLVGTSGYGKTELAALSQSHWGADLDARNLPSSWSSTANSLEELAFVAKDAILVVDDFAPAETSVDAQKQQRDAERLLRAQGNRSGHQRMRPDASLKAGRAPRGLILSTGEDVPKGQSLRARLHTIEMHQDDLNWDKLSECQQNAAKGIYAQAMAAYVQYLAPNIEAIRESLNAEISQMRDEFHSGGQHRRTLDILAQQAVGFKYFLAFAQQVGAVDETAADLLWKRALKALSDSLAGQTDLQESSEPARRFLRLILASLTSGEAHLASPEGGPPSDPGSWGWRENLARRLDTTESIWTPQGRRIGWFQDNDIYLDPENSFAQAQRLAYQQNEALGITLLTLTKRLRDKNLLASTELRGGKKSLRVRKTLQGQRRIVLHLKVHSFMSEIVAQVAQLAVGAYVKPLKAGQLRLASSEPAEEVAQPSSPSSRDLESIGQLGQPEIQGEDPDDDPWDDFI